MKNFSFTKPLLVTAFFITSFPLIGAERHFEGESQAKRQRMQRIPINNPRDFFTAQTAADVQQALANNCELGWQNATGETALHNAVKTYNLAVAQELMAIDQECILITKADENGFTPLHLAAQIGNLEFIDYICEHYEAVDLDFAIEKSDLYTGFTPLYLACYFAQSHVVEYLLDCGCETNIQALIQPQDKKNNDYQGTALTCACTVLDNEDTAKTAERRIAIITMLLQVNPELINAPEADQQTPLHLACEYKNNAVMAHLLAHGANPSLQNDAGETPLHIACDNGCFTSIALLLNHNAQVQIIEKQNRTAAHVAQASTNNDEQEETLALLYMYGADLPQFNNRLIATCIKHINAHSNSLELFLKTLKGKQWNTLFAQLPTLIEFACAEEKRTSSSKMITLLQKTFARYGKSRKPGYFHIAQLFNMLCMHNNLNTLRQNKVKCDVTFEFLQ